MAIGMKHAGTTLHRSAEAVAEFRKVLASDDQTTVDFLTRALRALERAETVESESEDILRSLTEILETVKALQLQVHGNPPSDAL